MNALFHAFSSSRIAGLLLPLFALLGLGSTGCSLLQPTDRSVIGQADQVHGSLNPAIINDPEVQRYIDQIGQRIIEGAIQMDREGKEASEHKGKDNSWQYGGGIKFHLVNSEQLNAFTTGGQHVYIYNQLYQEAQSEDELAAVMAHEFAHIYGRHVHHGITNQYYTLGTIAAGAAAGYLVGGGGETGMQYAGLGAGGAGAAAQMLTQGFTREDENEADKLGFRFYTRGGWDPEHFADFFKRLVDKGLDRPSSGSDHPSLSERVKKTEERVAQMSPEARQQRRRPPIADQRQYQAIQERARIAARNTPNDKSLAAAKLLLRAFPSCVTPEDQPEQKQAKSQLIRALETMESETPRSKPGS